MAGGEGVNQARTENRLPPVHIYQIEILGNTSIQDKFSSTTIRQILCDGLIGGERDLNELHDDWVTLTRRLSISEQTSFLWWSTLRDLHGLQPWRHYHTLRHVKELLEAAKSEFGSDIPPDLLLSIWFHDAVYDPRSDQNEENSISLFDQFITGCGEVTQKVDVEAVRLAISLSVDHRSGLIKELSKELTWIHHFLELDLSILGSNEERYREYTSQIRDEYSFLSDTEFREGRAKFLRSFADFRFSNLSPSAYLNANMIKNLEEELDQLEAR